MSKISRVLIVVALLALLLTGTVLAQSGSKQVGLVVQFPDGAVHTEVVTVAEDATVADVLKNASVSVTISETSWGPALCAIESTGCPADNCFCNPDMFWAFYLQEGDQWKPSPVGIGGYTPRCSRPSTPSSRLPRLRPLRFPSPRPWPCWVAAWPRWRAT